ncbi:hypothetical protein TW83_10035 [Paracoccus sp. S4493]|uniref:hypothetical protein n=1 Tax=Paracoccus sp. S4493 TaxID=579490 RepID=UPI0005F9B0D1|nr:hypothetical protein [Paracoccus sp. S4493]KJZ31252.1 hypothetical protein TW83_10035 [Paracoccus sp. S4493]
MAIIDADDFRMTTSLPLLAYNWPVFISGTPLYNSNGGRIVIAPNGGAMVRRMKKMSRFCIRFLLVTVNGTINSSRDLIKVNLNPAEMPSSSPSVSSDTNPSFELRIRAGSVFIARRAYDAAGNPVAQTQSVAAISPGFTPVSNGTALVEMMIDETGPTSNVTLVINGSEVLSADYPRAIGAHACDKGYGYLGVSAGGGSGMIGRIADLAVYTPEAPTMFPMGERFFTNLVISTSSETVTSELVKDVPDVTGITGTAIGVVTMVHADINGGASVANLVVEQIAPDGSVHSSTSARIAAGFPSESILTASAELTQDQINAMRIRYKVER